MSDPTGNVTLMELNISIDISQTLQTINSFKLMSKLFVHFGKLHYCVLQPASLNYHKAIISANEFDDLNDWFDAIDAAKVLYGQATGEAIRSMASKLLWGMIGSNIKVSISKVSNAITPTSKIFSSTSYGTSVGKFRNWVKFLNDYDDIVGQLDDPSIMSKCKCFSTADWVLRLF